MPAQGRLYKRAASNSGGLGPLWHVGAEHTLFIGQLDYNASHQHGAPVFLAGIDGPFGLRARGGVWRTCSTAVVPAGVLHELDVGGSPIAVFYVEPRLGVGPLLRLARGAEESDGVFIGAKGEAALFRELYDDPAAPEWAGLALQDLAGFCERGTSRMIDARVSRAVEILVGDADGRMSILQIAALVGLSPSRLQHLFTKEVGVPFRRYVAWSRMRVALRAIVDGANFTTSAHAAGFCDQAHFNHDFYRTFGAAPSRSLAGVRR